MGKVAGSTSAPTAAAGSAADSVLSFLQPETAKTVIKASKIRRVKFFMAQDLED